MLKGMLIGGLVLVGALVLREESALAQTAPQDVAPQNTTPAPAPLLDQALAVCYRCHGAGGVSTVATRPTIAGQKQAYVLQQLRSFKRAAHAQAKDADGDADDLGKTAAKEAAPSSTRTDPTMARICKNISEPMLVRLAEAVSQLACDGGNAKPASANSAPMPAPMPAIARRCAICHGENGIGTLPHIPNLAGQQRAYLRRQLLLLRETAWGAARRENESWRSHPIMEREAARISIEDVDGLARYYTSLDCRGAAKP